MAECIAWQLKKWKLYGKIKNKRNVANKCGESKKCKQLLKWNKSDDDCFVFRRNGHDEKTGIVIYAYVHFHFTLCFSLDSQGWHKMTALKVHRNAVCVRRNLIIFVDIRLILTMNDIERVLDFSSWGMKKSAIFSNSFFSYFFWFVHNAIYDEPFVFCFFFRSRSLCRHRQLLCIRCSASYWTNLSSHKAKATDTFICSNTIVHRRRKFDAALHVLVHSQTLTSTWSVSLRHDRRIDCCLASCTLTRRRGQREHKRCVPSKRFRSSSSSSSFFCCWHCFNFMFYVFSFFLIFFFYFTKL